VNSTSPAAPAGFRDPTALTRVLTLLLVVLLVIDVASLLSDIAQYQLLQTTFSPDDGNANDTRQHVIAILYMACYALTVIVFGRWTYVANKNARALGAFGMQFSPGWSVGWYFIPFANLFKPYQAMREIWNASENPQSWGSKDTDPVVNWWWAAFLISGFLGNMSFRAVASASDVSTLESATVTSIVSDAAIVFSIVLAWRLVVQVSRMQSARAGASTSPAIEAVSQS
jgi:hypothetical protein